MEIKADVNAVLVGRILAAVVIVMSFAYSVKAATSFGGFWVFLNTFTMPLALGFIIIVLSEILKVVQKDN